MQVPLARCLCWIPILVVGRQIAVRIIRRFYKFPMPEFVEGAVDDLLRHKLLPLDKMAMRHDIQLGIQIMEIDEDDAPIPWSPHAPMRKATPHGFHLRQINGNFFYYTLIFDRGVPA